MFTAETKKLFNLSPNVYFLNCATRGPFTFATEKAGLEAIINFTPTIHQIKPDNFFERAWVVRELFSQLVHYTDPARVAIVPSVSYAMAVMAKNLHRKAGLRAGQHILTVSDDFPSDVYAWHRVCKDLSLHIKTIEQQPIASEWNAKILENITPDTALVVMPHVHWQHGTKFDLEAISKRTKEVGALLAIDGTQSVGALDFDLQKIKPDLLVVVAYKWLLAPHSTGLAYFGEFFDDGIPLEETWMGRVDSNLLHKLTDYQSVYQPKAYRYNVGQHSHFIQMPMLEVALREKIAWGVDNIQQHCLELWQGCAEKLNNLGVQLDPEADRSQHLVGLKLPENTDMLTIQQRLADRQVFVAARGPRLRVSPHIYNTPEDMTVLVEALSGV